MSKIFQTLMNELDKVENTIKTNANNFINKHLKNGFLIIDPDCIQEIVDNNLYNNYNNQQLHTHFFAFMNFFNKNPVTNTASTYIFKDHLPFDITSIECIGNTSSIKQCCKGMIDLMYDIESVDGESLYISILGNPPLLYPKNLIFLPRVLSLDYVFYTKTPDGFAVANIRFKYIITFLNLRNYPIISQILDCKIIYESGMCLFLPITDIRYDVF